MLKINTFSPISTLEQEENTHIVYSFCTLCSLIKGKKLSYQNVLLLILQEERIYQILKDMLSASSKFEVVKLFLQIDPTISGSKYISKFLNSQKKDNKKTGKKNK